jgi:chromosome segregation ATPase
MQQLPHTAFASSVPVMFPTSNMPSPWHTAQFLQVQQPSMQTTWATAAAPPIEIEVHEPTSKTEFDTKISWTSAEQLADAIFPTNSESMTNANDVHYGLLNHKEQITNHQLNISNQHNGLLNHKTAIESQHDGLLNHKNEIENLLQMHAHLSNRLDLQTNSLSTHQVLQSANETKYNTLHKTLKDMQHSSNLELEKIEKVTAQLSTHEKGILHHTDILRDHKSKIDKTSMAISDYQRKTDNHDTDITSLQASLQNIERKLTKHDSTAQKLENLTESVDMIRRKLTNDTQQKLQDLHERCTAVESSQHLHSKKINSMMATNETQVQFQVLGPRRR